MGDSSSDNVSCISIVMFIIFSTEDGRLSSGLSGMFTWALVCNDSIDRLQPRPQGFLLDDFQNGGSSVRSELTRSLIGAFYCAFIRALSLVYSFDNKNGGSLGPSWKLRAESEA